MSTAVPNVVTVPKNASSWPPVAQPQREHDLGPPSVVRRLGADARVRRELLVEPLSAASPVIDAWRAQPVQQMRAPLARG